MSPFKLFYSSLGLLLFLFACRINESALPVLTRTPSDTRDVAVTAITPSSLPSATRTLAAATATPSPAPPAPNAISTPQGIDDAIRTITRALQSNDASGLRALMTDLISAAPEDNPTLGEEMTRDSAANWLNQRWGKRRMVVSSDYVEHFVLIEIQTTGWLKVAPLEQGVIFFHLHRYGGQGQSDPLRGEWRIDGLFYR